MTYLEFVELDDYIAHLRKCHGDNAATNLEFTHTSSKPSKDGIYTVTFHAVATANLGDHIAVINFPLYSALSFDLEHDHGKEERRARIQENFNKVRTMLEERGIVVERGKWSIEAPAYLRE